MILKGLRFGGVTLFHYIYIMIILPKYIGQKRTVRAKNSLLINVLIEQTEECVRLCKVLELDIFKKDAVKKESNKSKRDSKVRGDNDNK